MSDEDLADSVRRAGWTPVPEDQVPDDERMTPAEMRVIREHLGLTGEWLAARLGVQGRSWRRWEAGTAPIPDGVRIALEQLEDATARAVAQGVAQLLDAPGDPAVYTYRTDEEFHDAHPEAEYPASWHRALVARIAEQVPGLAITYPTV